MNACIPSAGAAMEVGRPIELVEIPLPEVERKSGRCRRPPSQRVAGPPAAVGGRNCNLAGRLFQPRRGWRHSAGVVWRGPRRFKEKSMKIRFQALDLARRAGLVLLVAGVPLAACTANSGDSAALDQTAADIKGGVPANGKTKENKGKR